VLSIWNSGIVECCGDCGDWGRWLLVNSFQANPINFDFSQSVFLPLNIALLTDALETFRAFATSDPLQLSSCMEPFFHRPLRSITIIPGGIGDVAA